MLTGRYARIQFARIFQKRLFFFFASKKIWKLKPKTHVIIRMTIEVFLLGSNTTNWGRLSYREHCIKRAPFSMLCIEFNYNWEIHICNIVWYVIQVPWKRKENKTSSVDTFYKLLEYFISMPDYENQIIQSMGYRIMVICSKTANVVGLHDIWGVKWAYKIDSILIMQ